MVSIAAVVTALLIVILFYFTVRKKQFKFKEVCMPQGLQCFNSDGLNTVDLTDRHLTYFGRVKVSPPIVASDEYTGTFEGIHPDTTLAYVEGIQVGSETDRLRRQVGLAANVTGPNTYKISAVVAIYLNAPHKVVFYKFG